MTSLSALDMAIDPAASVWVSANAGSGKTEALIRRVTRLLLDGVPPERILCLTFTKAAAAEMVGRLHEDLTRLAIEPAAQIPGLLGSLNIGQADAAMCARAPKLFARALETPGGLKIQTIHAFCERLIGRFPIEAGVPPHFDVLDERTAAALLDEARNTVLADALSGSDRALSAAVAVLAGATTEEGLEAMIRDRRGLYARAPDLRQPALDTELRAIDRALGLPAGETEASLTAALLAALPQARLREAAALLGGGSTTDRRHAAAIEAFLKRPATPDPLLVFFLTAEGGLRLDLATKSVLDRAPWLGSFLLAEQQRLAQFVERRSAHRAGAVARAAARVATRVLDRFETLKRARASLDFDDLIERTVHLLSHRSGAAAWVLYKLDGGIDHILVDEAQDTNPAQWAVIRALAEEFFSGAGARPATRTLFAVGDEKQSIYSFQGADPRVFDELRRRFRDRVQGAGLQWRDVPMPMSRRATLPLLELVDHVFAKGAGSPARAQRVCVGGQWLDHVTSRVNEGGLVELWPTEKPDLGDGPSAWTLPLDYRSPESPAGRLARRIAGEIASWLADTAPMPALGRPARPGDILILVRRRNHLVDEIIRQLKERRIPVAGTDRLMLLDHIAILDLMAAGAFALLPEDDLTLASVLRSPLVGLSDDALFALAHGRAGSLWEALRERTEAPFPAAAEWLADLLGRADAMPPHDFYQMLLGPMGGRERLLARLGLDAEDPIDEFLRLALDFEALHPPSLQGFLDWLETGAAEIKRDLSAGRGEVRVMTVHGAKGLQASIVILPDTCSLPPTDGARFLAVASGEGPPVALWTPNKKHDSDVLAQARAEVSQRAADEHLRLLYVALTRARDRLIVCGYEGKKGLPAESWYALVREGLLSLGAERTPEGGLRRDVPSTVRASAALAPGAGGGALSLPAWARLAPPREAPPRVLTPSAASEAEPAAQGPFAARGAERRRFARGRLIHRLLEILPGLPATVRASAAARFLALEVHALDEEAQAEIGAAAMGVFEAADVAPLFGPQSRAEVPLAGYLATPAGPRLVSGIVDRLCIERDRVFVIDYKTNRPPARTPDDVPLLYVRQMAAYRALLEQIYPGRPVACALLWTEGPTLMNLPERALDEAFAGWLAAPSP